MTDKSSTLAILMSDSDSGDSEKSFSPVPSPATTPDTSPNSTFRPEITNEMRQALALRMQGKSLTAIGDELGRDRHTISGWLKRLSDEALTHLENQSGANLLVEQYEKLKNLENWARNQAASTTSDRQKIGYINTALRAVSHQNKLLLETGILKREPMEFHQKILNVRADITKEDDSETESKPRREVIGELIQEMERANKL